MARISRLGATGGLSAASDRLNEIAVYDLATGSVRNRVWVSGARGMLLVDDDHLIVFTAHGLHWVRVSDGADQLLRFPPGRFRADQAAFAPDIGRLAVSGPGEIRIYDLTTMK